MKITCPKCHQEISNELNKAVTFCSNCGYALKLSDENAKPKSQFSTILLTSFITSILVLSIVGIGAYLYLNRNSTDSSTVDNSQNVNPNKPKISVSAPDITKIQMIIDNYRKIAGNNLDGQYKLAGNISLSNTTLDSKVVRFYADGKAEKITVIKKYDANSTSQKEEKSEFSGSISPNQFQELAEIIVKNDFMNHPRQQKDSPTLGTSIIQVSSSKGENTVSLDYSGKNSPQIEPIVQAIESLENKVVWKERK